MRDAAHRRDDIVKIMPLKRHVTKATCR